MTTIAVVLFGLVVGSFLSVVIARLPAGRSLWGPRSACPTCAAVIAWHDNIPVLSFIALGARCRACDARIAWRYPVVEIATAILFLAAYLRFGLSLDLVWVMALLASLVAITGIDVDHQIIPDAITLPGIVAGVLANLAVPGRSIVDSLLGIGLGGGIFLAIILVSGGGMGGGDVKAGAMLGAVLGWRLTLVAVLGAGVIGGLFAVRVQAAGP